MPWEDFRPGWGGLAETSRKNFVKMAAATAQPVFNTFLNIKRYHEQ
tara:strand:+ start:2640 stop:2777 length:138 start_codon:yes stop_codon:yes gene_type:complete